MRNHIAIQLVLQQCCKTSCTFLLPLYLNSYIVLEFTMIPIQEYDFSLQTNEDKIKIFCRTSYLLHSHLLGSLSNDDDHDDDNFKKQ